VSRRRRLRPLNRADRVFFFFSAADIRRQRDSRVLHPNASRTAIRTPIF